MIGRIVLFGASGDLAARYLMPALAQLLEEDVLPASLQITGVGTREWSAGEFRAHVRDKLSEHASGSQKRAREELLTRLDYQSADVTDPQDVLTLFEDRGDGGVLVYLALPPSLLKSALDSLAHVGLDQQDGIAIEKPFGTDLDSARALNETLALHLPRPKVFRIDHFLSDELVRRVLALRFMNRVFEPVLNAQHVERVDIHWLESLALEGRAKYYDKTGALKDMVQNHLMEALALVGMEQPARFDAPSFGGNRVEVLRAIPAMDRAQIAQRTRRARYVEGAVQGQRVSSYVDEEGVEPSRGTETYASVELYIDNARWHGVPFVLRSGKAMRENAAEIAIHFRSRPPLFGERSYQAQHNVLRIGLMEPYVRLGTTVNGEDFTPVHQELELCAARPIRSAYANLLLEMLRRRSALFIRGDEAEESWRIIDPISRAFRGDLVPLESYRAGDGPR